MRIARTVTLAAAGLALITTLAACGGGVDGSAQAAANSIQAAIKSNQTADVSLPVRRTPAGHEPVTPTSAPVRPRRPSPGRSERPAGTTVSRSPWWTQPLNRASATGLTSRSTCSTRTSAPRTATRRTPTSRSTGKPRKGLFDTPGIPGGGKAKGSVVLTVVPDKPKDTLTFDQAIDKVNLVYGDAADNQTSIPLAKSAEVASIEPKDLPAAGTLSQGQITIDVVSGTLVPSYESGEKGKSLLNLRVKLTCAAGCQAQGYNTGVEEFSVTGPDGTSVIADSRSEYCCDALYPETVSDSERNIVTFVVPSPGTGAYTLTYKNPSLTTAGTAPGTLAFTA